MITRRDEIFCYPRNDLVVRAVDQIVRSLEAMARSMDNWAAGILVAEHVQWPVVDCRPSKMRVVEAASEIALEHNMAGPRLSAVQASALFEKVSQLRSQKSTEHRMRCICPS